MSQLYAVTCDAGGCDAFIGESSAEEYGWRISVRQYSGPQYQDFCPEHYAYPETKLQEFNSRSFAEARRTLEKEQGNV